MTFKLNPSTPTFVPTSFARDFEMISTPISEPDKEVLKYPFSFIGIQEEVWFPTYDANDFSKGLIGEENCDTGNFPNNIVEFYWLHEGHNDEDAWMLLCKLDNGNFAFYTAWCDYTGFDCQGGMNLIVNNNLKRLFYEGLTERQRELCLEEKKNPHTPVTKIYHSDLACSLDSEPFKWDIPVAPESKPATEATKAFIRVWENGKELILNLDNLNGMEMEALEYAISSLISQFITHKDTLPPKKKFYIINICYGTSVMDIDDYFKKCFDNPDKKWELKMKFSGTGIIRRWGKVEVSFTLY